MSDPHDQLAAYVDGQLDDAESEAFALHLVDCSACRDALHDALQLVAQVAPLEAKVREARAATRDRLTGGPEAPALDASSDVAAARAKPRRPRRPWWRRGPAIAIAVAVASAAAALLLVPRLRRSPAEPPVALATAEARSLEGRISYPAADKHRPYKVDRAQGAKPADVVSPATLAELERRGDWHGIAAAYLMMNEARLAATYLDRAVPSADVASDRSLVERAAGDLPAALVTLDGVLEGAPRHAQALWNRAVVLRDLGLTLSAAQAFTQVAELGEPGWSEEARANAKALSDAVAERKAAFERLDNVDGPRLAVAPDAIAPEVARRFPGIARLYFYDAVRTAETADAVRALAPLARTLDAVYGGTVLADYVERVSRADFARRAPLARRFAALNRGQRLDASTVGPYLAALRAAKADDILLSTIAQTYFPRIPSELRPELRRVAAEQHDPWIDLLWVEQEARSLVHDGEPFAAEALLLPALETCRTRPIDYRCASLDFALGESYRETQRLPDARRVLAEGWARAQRAQEWLLERRFLKILAQLAVLEDDVAGSTLPLVRAYVGERVLRAPTSCAMAIEASEAVAIVLVNRFDLERARTEIARTSALERSCPAFEPGVWGIFIRAHTLRDPRSGSASDVAELRDRIAALRKASADPGRLAMIDQTEGRLLIDRDRAAGTALLEHAIANARSARADDIQVRKAASYAYTVLTLDAARAGEWDRVWQLLGDDAGFAPAARCVLGAAVEDRASMVVVRDAEGKTHGVYDTHPSPAIDAATFVPAQLRDAVRACSEVEVVARPPVQGVAALLPTDRAWSYRLHAARSLVAAEHDRRVVVSGAEPPAALGLARLLPWRSTSPPDVVLDGPAATPPRVLAEIADASFVEIHAHGIANATESDASLVMLSPDATGRYALTAAAIRQQPLRGHPIVILAACHAAVAATYRHQAWSLPAAFIAAGARAVIASTDVISDADAGEFFDDLRQRLGQGASVAVALRDTRVAWLAAHPAATWVSSLMVFQ